MTYQEFSSFFNSEPIEEREVSIEFTHANPALLQVIGKVHSLGLRRVFKGIDQDGDGLISTEELVADLIGQGLNRAFAEHPRFAEYLESFTKRAKGTFGFQEFNKFMNCRVLGHDTKIIGMPTCQSFKYTSTKLLSRSFFVLFLGSGTARDKTEIPEDASATGIFEIIACNSREDSVISVFREFDSDGNGQLSLEEFTKGLNYLGYSLNNQQAAQLFSLFDANGDGVLDMYEFSKTIVNPARNVCGSICLSSHAHSSTLAFPEECQASHRSWR